MFTEEYLLHFAALHKIEPQIATLAEMAIRGHNRIMMRWLTKEMYENILDPKDMLNVLINFNCVTKSSLH
jgi:hypothetical protein